MARRDQRRTNASGTWTTSQITTDRYDLKSRSLALTAAGKVHVAFGKFPYGPILDVTNTSGSWMTSQLTDGSDESPSLAVDGAGKVYVAYHRRSE